MFMSRPMIFRWLDEQKTDCKNVSKNPVKHLMISASVETRPLGIYQVIISKHNKNNISQLFMLSRKKFLNAISFSSKSNCSRFNELMNIYVRFVFPEMFQHLYTNFWDLICIYIYILYILLSVCIHIYMFEEMEAFCWRL